MRPWYGSMISTISRTMAVGVKNSPPFCPSDMASVIRFRDGVVGGTPGGARAIQRCAILVVEPADDIQGRPVNVASLGPNGAPASIERWVHADQLPVQGAHLVPFGSGREPGQRPHKRILRS